MTEVQKTMSETDKQHKVFFQKNLRIHQIWDKDSDLGPQT